MERDYVLGTADDEVSRLGLQHRVWRPEVLRCWRDAGVTTGSTVVDIGCGPGYATLDFAEIVGPAGHVTACERSERFLGIAQSRVASANLTNVSFHEIDFMEQAIPVTDADYTWCRWVACFVSSPALLMKRISQALRPGGRAMFHEYSDYRAWRLAPPRPKVEQFVHDVMGSWRDTGGEPDIGRELSHLITDAGMKVISVKPLLFAIRPDNYVWQWPSAFIQNNVRRLIELGRISDSLGKEVLTEFQEATQDPLSVMTTPIVFEILAEKP